jgi:hypothetical protein
MGTCQPKEPRRDNEAYLAQTRSENHDLIQFSHFLQEVVDSGPLDNVDVVPLPFNLDWDDIVGLGNQLERDINKVKNITFSTSNIP